MTADLWPWLAVAGLGALHGTSPANGWMFAAALGLRARAPAHARQALWPIAIGHAASIAAVAAAVMQGVATDRSLAQGLAGALLVGLAGWRCLGRARVRAVPGRRAGHAGLALWPFLMATAHGAGLMLVPALMPLCLADGPLLRGAGATGSLLLAMAAVALHTAAMLATTGLIATGVCRGLALRPRLAASAAARHLWTAALAVAGVLLMALR